MVRPLRPEPSSFLARARCSLGACACPLPFGCLVPAAIRPGSRRPSQSTAGYPGRPGIALATGVPPPWPA
jgi:hypothetical protein